MPNHKEGSEPKVIQGTDPVASGELLETFWECKFESSRYVVEDLSDVFSEMEEADVWNAYTIRKIRMTRKAFSALPEFSGF